ncbi:hypothetical protein BN8_03689 [Fibrisoma limi BUZ 3]|uniref:Uncharacterized protein n=1 Tax=Fibrisoma limi BUZ 3 TaxID=1185876 RepID=I2GKT5_9BACT|nr:hypothetical protein BN8_03689 [Fibrisoma limi BUZ 3]
MVWLQAQKAVALHRDGFAAGAGPVLFEQSFKTAFGDFNLPKGSQNHVATQRFGRPGALAGLGSNRATAVAERQGRTGTRSNGVDAYKHCIRQLQRLGVGC